MAGLGRNASILGRCAQRFVTSASTARARRSPSLVRNATTVAKPRATKPSGDDVSVPKKALSTKSPAVPSAKTPRKKAGASVQTPAEAVVVKKSTRSASTKISTKKKAQDTVSAKAPPPGPEAPARPAARTPPPKPVDINSHEYKAASRKWTSLMVGLPFLIVSSYFLYDRLVLGNMPKTLGAPETKSEA